MSTLFDDPREAEILDEIRREADRLRREGAGRIGADEAGAIAHAAIGAHPKDERCLTCPNVGRALLERLVGFGSTRAGTASPVRARATDPPTSHAAAASVNASGLTDRQVAVLLLFREVGQMTDEEVEHHYGEHGGPVQSDSGLRTRRHELVDLGYLAETPLRRPTVGGRQAIVWGITSDGLRAIRGRRAA
jgi:hypothetical protein